MTFRSTTSFITGERGALREELARHLASLGGEVLDGALGAASRADRPEGGLFHIWSPDPARLAALSAGWYEEAVSEAVQGAARLAGLRHLCLLRTEADSVPARVLEDGLALVARRRAAPFAVIDAPAGGPASSLAALAAFVASEGLGGRVAAGRRA